MAAPSTVEHVPYPIAVPSFSAWTVNRVRAALAQHDQGIFAESALLFEQIQRNPRTFEALNTRILGVLGLEFSLDSGDGDGRRNDPAVKRLKPFWPRIAPDTTSAAILQWRIGLGVFFGQNIWRYIDGDWINTVKPWHPSAFWWSDTDNCYYVNTQDAGQLKIRPDDPNWLLPPSGRERPWMNGVVRALGIEDTIRNFAVRDWARYSEIHGIPTRIIKVPADASNEAQASFVQPFKYLGSETSVIAPVDRDGSGFGVELLEAKDSSWEGFKQLIAQCDSDISVAIKGHISENKGVYTAKDNSEGVRQDYKEADAKALGEFYREYALKPWAAYNLGEAHRDSAPYPCWDPTPPFDQAAYATTLKTAGEAISAINLAGASSGSRVDFEATMESFGVVLEKVPANDNAAPVAAPTLAPLKLVKKPAALDSLTTSQAGLLSGQAYIDEVGDAVIAQAPKAIGSILAEVFAQVEASTDYEDLRERLAKVLQHADTRQVRKLTASALAMAQACGLWSVEEDN